MTGISSFLLVKKSSANKCRQKVYLHYVAWSYLWKLLIDFCEWNPWHLINNWNSKQQPAEGS